MRAVHLIYFALSLSLFDGRAYPSIHPSIHPFFALPSLFLRSSFALLHRRWFRLLLPDGSDRTLLSVEQVI